MDKPNLLFIFADEQAQKTMRAYGNSLIDTPNMDKLAEKSFVFDKAYVSQPVCTPSRSTLLTGLYPHNNGCTTNNVSLSDKTPCLPEMADFSAYRKAYMGKWHLGDEIFLQHGFDEWVSIDDGYRSHNRPERDQNAHSDYHHFLCENGFKPSHTQKDGFEVFGRDYIAELPEEYSKPAFLAREADKFLRQNGGSPFMLYINFFEPHMPFTGPRDGQYNIDDISLPENYVSPADDTPLKVRLLSEKYMRSGFGGLALSEESQMKTLIARYYGLCSQIDRYLGEIMDSLEKTGQADNTIIVYTSDHGDMMGAHKLVAKCVQYEEAVKVPLLISLPGKKPDRITNPVSQVDLVPTLLDYMGVKTEAKLDGYSLRPLIEKGEAAEKNVFIEWNGHNNGLGDKVGSASADSEWLRSFTMEQINEASSDPVRTVITPEGWKYNRSACGEHELYDLNSDPLELKNLAFDPAYKNRIEEYDALIHKWQKRTADSI